MDSAGFGSLVVVVHSSVPLGMPNKPKRDLHPRYRRQCVVGHDKTGPVNLINLRITGMRYDVTDCFILAGINDYPPASRTNGKDVTAYPAELGDSTVFWQKLARLLRGSGFR